MLLHQRHDLGKHYIPRRTVSPEEGIFLYGLTKVLRPSVIVEFGTYTGYTAVNFLNAMDSDAVLYTYDVERQSQIDLIQDSRFHFLRKNQVDFLPADIGGRKIDLVFLDASHQFDLNTKTFHAIRSSLKDKAVLVTHDTSNIAGQQGEIRFAEWMVEQGYPRIDFHYDEKRREHEGAGFSAFQIRAETARIPRWDDLSAVLKDVFTMGNTIRKLDYYIEDESIATEWHRGHVEELIEKARNKQECYYGKTDTWLYQCLDKYSIEGKSVAVVGSATPWYEAVCLSHGVEPTTIEYNRIKNHDNRLTTMTVEEYDKNPQTFDVVISISSIEHDGLGRYSDPINPVGDLDVMRKIKKQILKPGGLLLLAVPIGLDAICWNAHRIYGEKRWPELIQGFEVLDTFGDFDLVRDTGLKAIQPVVVLTPS
jgi:SAM-dependent methyltransferase